MAMADYYLCDICGNKAFYDANLSYDFDNRYPRVEYGCGMKLGYVGDMACICDKCAKTHKVTIVAKSAAAPSADAGVKP